MKNVKLDYFYCFIRNLDVSSMLFEVPSGAAADLFGRKKTVILGRICSVISCLLMLFASQFWQFGLAFVVSALGYNLNSGSEEALVYDSMKEDGVEDQF